MQLEKINNKKGQFGSIILILTILFMFMIITVSAYTIWMNYNSMFRSTVSNLTNDTQLEENLDKINYLMDLPNKIFIIIILGLWTALIISAIFTNPQHPFFFLIWLFFTIIITLIAIIIRNIGVKFMNLDLLTPAVNQNQIIAFIMQNFHWISLFLCITFGLVFYSKKYSFGGDYNQP